MHFRGGLTRSCKPGDTIKMSGMYLPEPFQGFRAMRAGLLSSTFLEAMHVQQLKQSYQQQADNHALQQRVAVRANSSNRLFACLPQLRPKPLHLAPSKDAATEAPGYALAEGRPSCTDAEQGSGL